MLTDLTYCFNRVRMTDKLNYTGWKSGLEIVGVTVFAYGQTVSVQAVINKSESRNETTEKEAV